MFDRFGSFLGRVEREVESLIMMLAKEAKMDSPVSLNDTVIGTHLPGAKSIPIIH